MSNNNQTESPSEQEPKFRARPLFQAGPPSATPIKEAYPLCDRAGAPACGNVGQPGRPDKASR